MSNIIIDNMTFKSKVFNNEQKFNSLMKLVRTGKYSPPKLTNIFSCDRKTIHRILNHNGTFLPNLGRFKKKVYCNTDFFKNLNATSAYWAGFIAADGCLYTKYKNLSISLKKSDVGHLFKFKNAIKTNAKISHIKSNNSVRISIYSIKIFDSLVALGIEPKKSLSIQKIQIPSHLISHSIRGVFDGDGSISGKKITHVQFQIAGNKPFLEQIQDILIKECGVNKVKIYPLNSKNKIHRLQYTGSQIFEILKFIYKESTNQTRLERKYRKYISFKQKFRK